MYDCWTFIYLKRIQYQLPVINKIVKCKLKTWPMPYILKKVYSCCASARYKEWYYVFVRCLPTSNQTITVYLYLSILLYENSFYFTTAPTVLNILTRIRVVLRIHIILLYLNKN